MTHVNMNAANALLQMIQKHLLRLSAFTILLEIGSTMTSMSVRVRHMMHLHRIVWRSRVGQCRPHCRRRGSADHGRPGYVLDPLRRTGGEWIGEMVCGRWHGDCVG